LPAQSDGIITRQQISVHGREWSAYCVGGSPAQAVLHALYEILPERPQLVVSGINYGENLAIGVTVSGTVGAALEAAARGIPALAVSLETDLEHHLSYSPQINFSAAAHFTGMFARLVLQRHLPEDVDVLKIDVPSDANPETPWEINRLSKREYFEPVAPQRKNWDEPGGMGYRTAPDPQAHALDSDVYAVCIRRVISVTPLSLDLTSRVDLQELKRLLI
jgi:5'-nucleotidase